MWWKRKKKESNGSGRERTMRKPLKQIIQTLFSSKYLIYTNISISMLSSGTGDAIVQNLERMQEKKFSFDRKRNFNMTMTGFGSGFFCHHWYKFLDRKIKDKTLMAAVKKVCLDQIIGSPFCIINMFVTLAFLESTVFNDAVHEFVDKYFDIYTGELMFAPPSQFINFYFVPLKYRIGFENIIALGFDVFLSYIKHQPRYFNNDCPKE